MWKFPSWGSDVSTDFVCGTSENFTIILPFTTGPTPIMVVVDVSGGSGEYASLSQPAQTRTAANNENNALDFIMCIV
jgi:hypothetical protein